MVMHDDSLNADLIEALVSFSHGYKAQIGRLPTAGEFAETLTMIIQTTGANLFADAGNSQLKIVEFKFINKKPSVDLQYGDIYYFPSTTAPSKCVFLGFLGRIRPYGDVFVSFRGLHSANVDINDLVPFPYPFISGNKLIQTREWKLAGNKPDIFLTHGVFPEIYLNKAFYPKREDIGPYGQAERTNPDGSITKRNLTKEEARQVGIFQNRNDMVCQPDEVEDFIKSRNWI
jgi:hypothetical protein